MADMLKKISPVFYVVIVLSFFLTFVNITCAGTKIASLSGFEVAFGTTIEQPGGAGGMFGGKGAKAKETTTDPNATAIIALVIAVAGIILSFVQIKQQSLILIILSALGFIVMLMVKSSIGGDISKQPVQMLEISYGIGYYLALLFFIIPIVTNVLIMVTGKKEVVIDGLPPANEPPPVNNDQPQV